MSLGVYNQGGIVVEDGVVVTETIETADGKSVERRPVETGHLTNAGIVIHEGLTPGERIVTQGGHLLSDGALVRVVAPEGNAS